MGVKCKRPKITKTIDELLNMPKIPTTQNIAKNRTNFPMHEISISNSSKEAIT